MRNTEKNIYFYEKPDRVSPKTAIRANLSTTRLLYIFNQNDIKYDNQNQMQSSSFSFSLEPSLSSKAPCSFTFIYSFHTQFVKT